jgi:hypothetical protein
VVRDWRLGPVRSPQASRGYSAPAVFGGLLSRAQSVAAAWGRVAGLGCHMVITDVPRLWPSPTKVTASTASSRAKT